MKQGNKFDKLIKLIRKEKVTLFIGSGFSLKAGAPSANQLVEAIIAEAPDDFESSLNGRQLDYVANEFVISCGDSRNELIQILKDKMEFERKDLSDHKKLAQIPHFHNIFTTNYDTLLEDNYSQKKRTVIKNDAACAYDIEKDSIYKLHGDLGDLTNPDSVIITQSDYNAFFTDKKNPLMWGALKEAFKRSHMLFIGYSLQDYNVIEVMKSVRNCIGDNMKQSFLIAPNMKDVYANQLVKNGVNYLNANAEDFLIELLSQLKLCISDDFKHKKCSSDTFARFCHINNINPKVIIKEKENQISEFKPLDNKALKCQINMNVPLEYRKMIENCDWSKMGEIIPNSPMGSIPVLKIPLEKTSNFSYVVNAVKMMGHGDVKEIGIAPLTHKIDARIRIPEIGFLENKKFIAYRESNHTFCFVMDCDIYSLRLYLDIRVKEEIECRLTFKEKEKYTSHSEAEKWIQLPLSLFQGKDVYFKGILEESFNSCKEKNLIDSSRYSEMAEYYKNIKDIELYADIQFTEYDNYNKERYDISCYVLSYLKGEPMIEKSLDGWNFSCVISNFSKVKNEPIYNDYDQIYCLAQTRELHEPLKLNRHEFKIPYQNFLMKKCRLISLEENLEDDTASLKIHNDEDERYTVWADQPIKEMGNKLLLKGDV